MNHLSNRVFDDHHAIVDACCDAWNALAAEPGRIQSIATRPWAAVNRERRWRQHCDDRVGVLLADVALGVPG